MTRRTHATARRAGRDALTIAMSAPQVIQMRMARMAAHGMNPNPSERREMHLMGSEKMAAFSEAWLAMGQQAVRMQQVWWQQWFQMLMRPMSLAALAQPASLFNTSGANARAMARQATQGMARVAAVGLAPLSRRVSSNVKRLSSRNGATKR